jgi:hypothetical protein
MATKISSKLHSIAEVQAAIAAGESLFLAGSRAALSQLPRGNWVGGTISYFMAEEGGQMAEDRIFVTAIPAFALSAEVAEYGPENLQQLYNDAPENGFTFLAVPAFTEVVKTFAQEAPNYDGFLFRPVVGWVSGVRLDRIGIDTPGVFNGKTGAVLEDKAVALHVALPANKIAELEIVNTFEPGTGDLIHFEKAGFHVTDCLIAGQPVNLADYILEKGLSTEIPLVGDYSGSSINVSFQKVDLEQHTVDLFAPVFPGVDYRFAKPVADYEEACALAIQGEDKDSDFACNCLLNYLYGKLEGKKTGHVTGPITFGEIAHQLLNQTMVRLYLHDIG